ncbi:MAG: response regulator [Paenibacillaceae bacterium]|nr:response regulator [Paenibacillaceae bacterium]
MDDEEVIRRGVAKMIEASPITWTIAGEAENGAQALELIGRVQPDLVITDIRMPEMDGIELCRRISLLGRPLHVIMLTAHKDFEFAQAALRYGAIDFLLKPCSMEELTRSLEKAYHSYSQLQNARERAWIEECRLQEHNIRSWLLGLPMEEDAMESIRQDYGTRQLHILSLETYTPASRDYRTEDVRLLQFAVLNIMKELHGMYGLNGAVMSVRQDQFAVLEEPQPLLGEFISQVVQTVGELLGLNLIPSDLGFNSLHKLYGKLATYGVAAEEKRDGMRQINLLRSKSVQSDLMSFIVQGKTEQLREYLEQCVEGLRQLDPGDAKIEGLNLATALSEVERREFSPAAEADSGGSRLTEWISALAPVSLSEEVADWALQPVNGFMWQLNSWLAGKNVNLFDKAIRYIERNYKHDCSIHDVAQHVHLSVSYFSNLFKKETGDNYTNYLTRFRLDKAKVLLSNTNMKISEIAEAVGYDDPNYFTTVFRHWQQCSPSEYRKQGPAV